MKSDQSMLQTTPPVIQLDNIHLTLGEGASQVHVLRGISLDVPSGKSVGIVGPSGSGKSTLLMVMAGLLERVIMQHTVLVQNPQVTREII